MKTFLRMMALVLCLFTLFSCIPSSTPPEGPGENPPEGGEQDTLAPLTPYVHFSFDDMEFSFRNLKNNNYASLWDEPFFAALAEAHENYGACFSLYVWKDVLHEQPTRYQAEWQACSDWLKIGLHSDGEGNFAEADYTRGKTEWEHFVADVYAMTGSYDCIDYIPRLHNFAGSAEALRGMQEAEHGALGFLAADDTRISYDHTQEQSLHMQENDYLVSENGKLVYLTTDIRFENYESDSIYDVLTKKWGNGTTDQCFILFTHEYELYDGTTVNENFFWLDEAGLYFTEKSIPFGFPQAFAYEKK